MPCLRDRSRSDPGDPEGAGGEVRGHPARQHDDHLSTARRRRTRRDRSFGPAAVGMKAMTVAVRAGTAMLLAAALSFATLAAQPPPTTTDDPRRVPLPPPKASDRPALLIVNATLIDGTGARARPGTDVLIEGDRITALGPTGTLAAAAQAAKRIDASG